MNSIEKIASESYNQGAKDTMESVKLSFQALRGAVRATELSFDDIDTILDSICEELETL